jgi:3-oxoacyl-(acyl-carrier-protein) synthase/NRPS condensation-like uncharacterized protein/NADP-dependent 3-hydroxy acid dehydrogenase YdfG/acyl carrier protein
MNYSSSKKDLAIIGMAGVFPDADNLADFNRNLTDGKDSVKRVSESRLMYSCIDPFKKYKEEGLLERVDLFDYKFFSLSKSEAELMDPQQRILLQMVCHAMYNAAYSLESFRGSKTGVYIAAGNSGYQDFIAMDDPQAIMGNMNAALAGKIAYLFDLHGPAMMINTACSSSLVAIIEACNNILLGNIDCALAGGIRIATHLEPVDEEVKFDSLESSDRRCKAFDHLADGIVGGEGGGVLLIKSLDKALADKDSIHAIIKGYAMNQDGGRTVGITAPSPIAQTEMLIEAWQNSNISPETISYIEAHGTGTKLGDPIEIKALTDAFKKFTNKTKFCAISSLKTNIGHLDTASGVAGVLKAILSLKSRRLFPSLHFNKPNELIDFDNSAIYVNDRLADWTVSGGIRRAGVSAFGLSGTNAHIVLEEFIPTDQEQSQTKDYLFKFSAKSLGSLNAYLKNISDFAAENTFSLCDLSYTLTRGRDDFKFREAFVASDKHDFLAKINTLINDGKKDTGIYDRDLVLLFSGTTLPDETALSDWKDKFPIFKEKWNECFEIWHYELSVGFQWFAFYYASYYLLKSFGISSNNLVGFSWGNLAVSVLAGKKTLAEALQEIKNFNIPDNLPNRDKLLTYLQKLQTPVCMEWIPGGQLADALHDTKYAADFFFSGSNLLGKVGDLYKINVPVDWEAAWHHNGKGKRLEVPGYAFEKSRAWYAEPLKINKDISNWFYDIAWKPFNFNLSNRLSPKRFLIFMDNTGFGSALIRHLHLHDKEVAMVYFKENDHVMDDPDNSSFYISSTNENDYIDLYRELSYKKFYPDVIIHLGNCSNVEMGNSQEWSTENELVSKGLYSQFLLTKAFSDYLSSHGCHFLLVSSDAYDVTVSQKSIHPERSASFGFLRGLLAEYPLTKAKFIDFSLSENPQQYEVLIPYLLNELNDEDYYGIAYRNGQRWVQSLSRLNIEESLSEELKLKSLGVYLVTGGTSGIGFEICKMLLENAEITLIVAGRSPEDAGHVFSALAKLKALASHGSKVVYHSCNMGISEEVKLLIAAVLKEHGSLNGIIHSAALPGRKRIKHNTIEEFQEVIASRVIGTRALVESTAVNPPDFTLICSSLSSLVAAYPRKSDYASGCVFADTFVRTLSNSRKDVKVIHWCDWQETGMTWRVVENQTEFLESNSFLRLKNHEGLRVLKALISMPVTNVFLLGNYQAIQQKDIHNLHHNPYFAWAGNENGRERIVDDKEKDALTAISTLSNHPNTADVEIGLTKIWISVLKVEEVKPDDNFFELGGQSLNGYTILKQIENEFGVELEIDDLFDYPVFSELATHIDTLRYKTQKAISLECIPQVQEQLHYELSQAQKRLWILCGSENIKLAYNIPLACVFNGKLDIQMLEKSVCTLIERHEILRTTFSSVKGDPRQFVHAHNNFPFEIQHYDFTSIRDSHAAAMQAIEQHVNVSFDLENGPLFKASLFRVSEDRFIFLFNMHHIISDGWSVSVIVKDILMIYDALLRNDVSPIQMPRIQYKDFAHWHNQVLVDEKLTPHRAYWINKLSGQLMTLNLPLDFVRPKVRSYQGARLQSSIDEVITQKLRQLNKTEGTTMFIMLQAILKVLLFKYCGQDDISIGTPIAGRVHEDLQDQVGLYLNNLVLRDRVDDRQPFSAFLQEVKKTTFEAFNHQLYPYDKIIEDLKVPYDKSRNPLYDVLLSMSNFDVRDTRTKNSRLSQILIEEDVVLPNTISKLDLSFFVDEHEKDISLVIEYRTDLFAAHTIARLMLHYQDIARLIADSPNLTITSIKQSLMDESDKREHEEFENYITGNVSEEF